MEKARIKRKKIIRAKIRGTKDRPRLCVFRSNKHLYAQIIDDQKGITLAAASDREIAAKEVGVKKAYLVGEALAKKARKKKIEKVVFDRAGYQYHGKIKALADGARKGGLEF